MITILLQKILAALTQLLGDIKTKLNTIKDNLDNLIVVATAAGPIASFTTTLTRPLLSCIVDVPESVSGIDTIIITDCGVNIWDEETELGIYDPTTGEKTSSSTQLRSKNFIKVAPTTTYFFQTATANNRVLFYDKDKNYLNDSMLVTVNTFTTPENCYYITFHMGSSYGVTYRNNVSINFPATITTYEAYSATPTTVTLPETVYGGEVDILDIIKPDVITAKNGVNNIFSDSGDVTVEYLKLYKEV